VALPVSWLFLALFAILFLTFPSPRVPGGSGLAMLFAAIAVLPFVAFAIAAATFSRDVVSGRYAFAAGVTCRPTYSSESHISGPSL
jgi:hypothetical protein